MSGGWRAVSRRQQVSHFSLLKSHFPQSQPFPRATLSMSLCSASAAEGLALRRGLCRAVPAPPHHLTAHCALGAWRGDSEGHIPSAPGKSLAPRAPRCNREQRGPAPMLGRGLQVGDGQPGNDCGLSWRGLLLPPPPLGPAAAGPRALSFPQAFVAPVYFPVNEVGGGCVLAAAPGDAEVLKASPPGGCSLRPQPLPSPAPAPGGLRVPPARASAAWGLTPPARDQGQTGVLG